ncbi:MAG: hypothetical protein R3246_10950, partial [Acidimicrobiia bacterium]|nr:hypothetical protein [Acidimicrobiia bacterium]
MRRLVVMLAVAALVGALVPAARSQPAGDANQLTLGDWIGKANAWGTALVFAPGGTLQWDATFLSDFTFTVTTDGVEGTFDLRTRGLNFHPTMTMTFTSQAGTGVAEFNVDPGATGVIDGTRDLLVFSIDGVTTSGTFTATGVEVDIDGNPSNVVVENTIEYLSCDLANGTWVVEVSQMIQDAGWNGGWSGAWWAAPRPPELQENDLDVLIDGMGELFDDYGAFEASLGFGDDFNPPAGTWIELYDLVERATQLHNELHNLSECDAEAI